MKQPGPNRASKHATGNGEQTPDLQPADSAKARIGGSTSRRLLEAAAAEFNEHGFAATDTNKIARRAGFAPQTFYRWFADKVDAFIQVYDQWRRDQFTEIGALLSEGASDTRVAQAVVSHHTRFLVFRRSLRQLSLENDEVRAARAKSRLQQISFLKAINPAASRDEGALAAALLQTERLADALAEGELQDMELSEDAAMRALERLIHALRAPMGT